MSCIQMTQHFFLSSSDSNILQKDLDVNLNKIANWFQTNNLTLNIKKTKLM